MDGLFILAAIAWIVLSAVNRKKKQEQQRARREAAGQTGAAPDRQPVAGQSPAPQRPAPARQSAPAAPQGPRMPEAAFAAAEGDTAPVQKQARQERPKRPVAPPESRVGVEMHSTLRGTTLQHTLEVSSISGHAHEETSITGIQAEPCAPGEPARSRKAAFTPAADVGSGFSWNQNTVLQGMVMAEILGKPRALRQCRR